MKNDKDKDKEPKLHIDDDWKAEAQAEKEKLSKEESAAEPASERGPLPGPSFSLLVISLVSQARICLGDLENPITKKKQLDLEAAKHHIDMLEMLDAKTSGNLSDEEKNLLDSVLYELRMRYVQLS